MGVSELEFRSDSGIASLQDARAETKYSSSPRNEDAEKAIDGDRHTKWLDFSKGTLIVSWKDPQRLTSFRFVTANDYSSRDPVQWELKGSNDQQHWALLHAQHVDYATPVVRRTETQWFKFNLSAEVVEDVAEGFNQEGYNADTDYTPQYVDELV